VNKAVVKSILVKRRSATYKSMQASIAILVKTPISSLSISISITISYKPISQIDPHLINLTPDSSAESHHNTSHHSSPSLSIPAPFNSKLLLIPSPSLLAVTLLLLLLSLSRFSSTPGKILGAGLSEPKS
jgi:hypothetical protein